MAIPLPNRQTRLWQQNNESDILGTLDRSFNLDLTKNLGRTRTTRMKRVENSGDNADIELIFSFVFYNGSYWAFTDDFAYEGGATPDASFTKDTSSNAPNGELVEAHSDAKVFNDAIYVSGSNEIMKYTTGGGWSTPITTDLTAIRPHLLEPYGDLLYVTDDYYKIHHITTSDVINDSGTSTLDLLLDDTWVITMLKAGYDRLWVGLVNTVTGKGLMFEWDGQTENITSRRYELDAGVVAGVVYKNIPYFIDTKGKLMAYNGGAFREIARFPKESAYRFDDALEETNIRFIHPNGIQATNDGRILILMKNELENSVGYEDKCPSGIWEYDPDIGLYHKYSFSYSDTGSTTITDYGQQRVVDVGALFFNPPEFPTTSTNGILLASADYFTDASSNEYGIFCDDTLDTTQKYATLDTTWLQSDQIDDVWQKIFAKNKKFLDSSDKIVVKYRVDYDEPTEATITWSDTDTFTTTSNLSSYLAGDEVEVVQGSGSGKTAHIASISEAGGTYTVNLDETFTGASGTAKALVSKWIKLGEYDSQDKRWDEFTIAKDSNSPQIKIKLGMQFTGENELHEIIVVNRSNTQAR